MSPIPALTWRNLGIYHIYGANTDVGKTIFATALCRAASALYTDQHTSYLKPVSTGPEDEADARCECEVLMSPLKKRHAC